MDELRPETAEKSRRRSGKVWIFAALAVLAVVILTAVLRPADGKISLYYSPEQNGVLVFSDDRFSGEVMTGKGVSSFRFSGGETSCAVLVPGGGAYTLYYTDGETNDVVADNSTNNYVIAYSGSAVVYTDSVGLLRRYDTTKKKTDTLSDGADRFAVSPDGSRVLFTKTEEGNSVLYLYEKGSASRVGEQYIPLAVSDDASYIYALSADNSLCLLNRDGTMRSKLCSQTNPSSLAFSFSSDISSVVFSDQSYTYISHEGKSRIRMISGVAEPVLQALTVCDSYGVSHVFDDDDLTDIFYASHGTTDVLFAVTKESERVDINSSVAQFDEAGDDALVYISDQGRLYLYHGEKSEAIADGVSQAVACKNGKYIYYITANADLIAYHGGKTRKLASDAATLSVTADNKLLFLLTDGSLYVSSGMKYGEKVDESVRSCYVTDTAVFYMKNYNAQTGLFELYASSDSSHFKKAFDAVTWIM